MNGGQIGYLDKLSNFSCQFDPFVLPESALINPRLW